MPKSTRASRNARIICRQKGECQCKLLMNAEFSPNETFISTPPRPRGTSDTIGEKECKKQNMLMNAMKQHDLDGHDMASAPMNSLQLQLSLKHCAQHHCTMYWGWMGHEVPHSTGGLQADQLY